MSAPIPSSLEPSSLELVAFDGPWTATEKQVVRWAPRAAESHRLPPPNPQFGVVWIATKDEPSPIYAATRQRLGRGLSAQSAGALARRIRAVAGDES